jgi:galactose mutarotase-like enzyme
MVRTIKNDLIAIAVDSHGAELTSFKTIGDDLEFLWQKDSRYWTGQAPVLFPVVGGLPDNRYQLGEQTYEMKTHGFARDSEFELVKNGSTELVFKLGHNEDTLLQYPFAFELRVKYRLVANTLWHSFQVINPGDKTMLFSVGAHPGFRCPLYAGEKMEDYYLLFEKPERLRRRIKTGTVLSGETRVFLDDEREKNLSRSLFDDGAIILAGVESKWLEIRNRRNGRVIKAGFDGFPYLGIWSAPNDAPFVCIEPWYGIDSTRGDSPDFAVKEGLQRLAPGETFECGYSITVDEKIF